MRSPTSIITASLLAVVGCADSNPDLSDAIPKQSAVVAEQSDLEGAWNSGCIAPSDGRREGDSDTQMIRTFTDNDTSYQMTMYSSSDGSCSETSALLAFRILGTFTGGEDNGAVDGAKNLDFTLANTYMTTRSAEMVTMLNAGTGMCGITDWAEDVEQEITGKTCDFGRGGGLPTLPGTVILDIYKIAGDTAMFGADSGDARPTALDTVEFTRE